MYHQQKDNLEINNNKSYKIKRFKKSKQWIKIRKCKFKIQIGIWIKL